MQYGNSAQRGDNQSLKDLADAVNASIRLAKSTRARLEVHGSILVLREGAEVHALGVIDNGDTKFFDPKKGGHPY